MISKIFAATTFALVGMSSVAVAQTSNCYSNAASGGAVAYSDAFLSQMNGICSVQTPGAPTGSRWDTRAFVGLAVSFGTGDYSPKGGVHLTAGVRRTNVGADNNVYGAELHGSINLLEWKDIQLRALGLFGNRDVLGNAGIGFDIFKLTPLAVAGVQIPYGRAFVDVYAFNWNVRGFAEVNTYGRIKPVAPSLPSCGSGTTLMTEQQAADAVNSAFRSTGIPFNPYDGGILTGSLSPLIYRGTPAINGLPSSAWNNGQTCFSSPSFGGLT